jgi:hypothetical protein
VAAAGVFGEFLTSNGRVAEQRPMVHAAHRSNLAAAEEAVQSVSSLIRDFLWEKVSGTERVSLNNLIAPSLPKRNWSRLLNVPSTQRPVGAPEDQDRARDSTPADTVRLVMLAVEGRRCSIVFADSIPIVRRNVRRGGSRRRRRRDER